MGAVELEVGPQSNPAVRSGGPGPAPNANPSPPGGGRAGATPEAGAAAPGGGRAQASGARVTVELLGEAVSWAVKQHGDPASRFHGRLDLDHIVSMGHSCGGVLALRLAQDDARVNGVGVWFSGLGLTGGAADPAPLQKIKGPVLLITGEEKLDIGFPAGKRTFDAVDHLPVFYGWQDGLQHIGTFGARNGGDLGVITVSWLEWTTRGDGTAGRMFKGPNCTLCKDPTWHIQRKKIS
jgi:hypothetical protein